MSFGRNPSCFKITTGRFSETTIPNRPARLLVVTGAVFIAFTKSFAEENIFTVDNVAVNGQIDINFSREKYINIAILNSFEILTKTKNTKQINIYQAVLKILIVNMKISI